MISQPTKQKNIKHNMMHCQGRKNKMAILGNVPK